MQIYEEFRNEGCVIAIFLASNIKNGVSPESQRHYELLISNYSLSPNPAPQLTPRGSLAVHKDADAEDACSEPYHSNKRSIKY